MLALQLTAAPVEVKVRDLCASLAGGRVCSAAALGRVGTPTRHCHGHTYPSVPSQPPLANWKFFLHLFPQNGQTLRSVEMGWSRDAADG